MESASLNLPARLLKVAYLVGKIPFRACRVDQRISYTLYIPPKQYGEVHEILRDENSSQSAQYLPLIINVHGTRRDAVTCRDSLINFADENGVAVLAPFYPAGLDGSLDMHSYKHLRTKTLKSDIVLLAILDEVKQIWPGIDTRKAVFMGFSGGAQFVHRFAYFHSERVKALCVAAPGKTTLICDEPWPNGVGDVAEIFSDQKFDPQALQQIARVCFIIGTEDNEAAMAEASELKNFLKQSAKGAALVAKVGESGFGEPRGRVNGLRDLQSNWLDHGINVEFKTVPGVAHSYLESLPTILEWLGDVWLEEKQGR